jgi:hypothetical protein
MRVCTERAGRKGDRLVHLGKGTVEVSDESVAEVVANAF